MHPIKKINSLKKIHYILLIALVLFAMIMPNLYRVMRGNSSLISDISQSESYKYADYAKNPQGMPQNSYLAILSLLSPVMGEILASKILPFILGLLSLLFLYLTLKRFDLSLETPIILLILAFSPAFLYLVNVSTKFALMQTLLSVGLYFLMRKSALDKIISVFMFTLLASFGIYALLIPLLGLFFYMLVDKRKRNVFLLFLISSLLLISFLYLPNYIVSESHSSIYEFGFSNFTNYLSDFGGQFAISIFALLLCFFGIFITWESKKKYGYLYLYSLLLIILAFFVSEIIWFANLVIAFYVGIAIIKLFLENWTFKKLKFYTLLLIACSLLFSSLVSVQTIANLGPSSDLIDSLNWLNQNAKSGQVLTSINDAYVLEYYGLQSFLKTDYNDLSNRKNLSNAIYHAQDVNSAKKILNSNRIRYIIMSDEMKNQIWENQDIELLFLLEHSKSFKKVYENFQISVWEVRWRYNSPN